MAQQNSFGLEGPFANVLEQPYQQKASYQSTAPPTVSGYGGKTEGLAMLADKFLSGVSQGRRAAFERSENQRQQSLNALGAAMRDIQQAPIPDALKQQKLAELQRTQLQMIVGDHSIEGSGSKDKKGGKGNDQDQNPVLGLVRHFASNLLGPGAEKQPVSTEQLQATIGDVYSFLRDPRNSIQNQVKNADNGIMTIYGQMQAQNGGQPLTWSQLMQNPQFQKAANSAMYITNGAPTPGLKMIMQSAQDAQAQQDPRFRAQVDAERARAEEARARAEAMRENEAGQADYNAQRSAELRARADLERQRGQAILHPPARPTSGRGHTAAGTRTSGRPDHWVQQKVYDINKTADAAITRVETSKLTSEQRKREIDAINQRRQNEIDGVSPPTQQEREDRTTRQFIQDMFAAPTGGQPTAANTPSAGAAAASAL